MQKGADVMTEQALAARRAYKRQWAKNNPDKIKAQQERFWAKKAAKMEIKTEENKKEKDLDFLG